jgi:enoyl-CoA hydratase/carnithine racemase
LIRKELKEGVAIVSLDRGVTNPLNLQLVTDLSKALAEIKDDPESRGVVLTSTSQKFFSIGLDIPWMYPLSREQFTRFYQAFNRVCMEIYTFPKPVVAALLGHAVAGGCILALACDYRVIAEGKKLMGLNEIKLGVPVPFPGHCMLQQLLGYRKARDLTDTGEFLPAEQLLQIGLVDDVLLQDQVLPRAIQMAGSLGAFPPEAFAAIKRNRVAEIEARVRAHGAEKEAEFLDCWHSPGTRARLKEAMEKF